MVCNQGSVLIVVCIYSTVGPSLQLILSSHLFLNRAQIFEGIFLRTRWQWRRLARNRALLRSSLLNQSYLVCQLLFRALFWESWSNCRMMVVHAPLFLPPIEEWLLLVLWSLGFVPNCFELMWNTCLRGWLLGKMFRFCSAWNCSTRESARLSIDERSGSSRGSCSPPNNYRLNTPVVTLWGMNYVNIQEQTVSFQRRMEIFPKRCQQDLRLGDVSWWSWTIYSPSLRSGQQSWYSPSRPSSARYLAIVGVNCVLICETCLRCFQDANYLIRLFPKPGAPVWIACFSGFLIA